MSKQRGILVKILEKDSLIKICKELKLRPKSKYIKSIILNESNGKITNSKIKYKKPIKRIKERKNEWQKNWVNLIDFETDNKEDVIAEIEFIFENNFSQKFISDLFDQTISDITNSIYYPKKEPNLFRRQRILSERGNPQYPIYIISKGRADCCYTADHLIKMEVPFRIVIENQEWKEYSKYYDENILLELDKTFIKDYDTYIENFDENLSKGSGPARNFVWDHAKKSGAKWHWIMDDNINGFYYFNNNQRIMSADGGILTATEDFINRYENIAIAGNEYTMFVVPGSKKTPYISNTKIYSSLLIRNDVDLRWAGRYNEDVDLCIRAMKEGYSILRMEMFCSDKLTTQAMGGGNTDAFYASEGTFPKSKMLEDNHPDIVEIVWRYSRWHHLVDYSKFKINRNRSIEETITALNKKPVLTGKETKILNEIRSLNLDFNLKYVDILTSVDSKLRERILEVIKIHKYRKDNAFIIKKLTAPAILESNDIMFLGDSNDDIIVKKLIELYSGDNLHKYYDLDIELAFVDDEKRERIKHEIKRNKYLLHDKYEIFTYNLKKYLLTEDEHKSKMDSKAFISKKYLGLENAKIPLTQKDKIARGLIKKKQRNFKKNIIRRGENNLSKHGLTICVTGEEGFSDKEKFNQELNLILQNLDEQPQVIINGVVNYIDRCVAEYSLEHNIKSAEFVPDFHGDGDYALDEHMKNMIDSCDILIFFSKDKKNFDIDKPYFNVVFGIEKIDLDSLF